MSKLFDKIKKDLVKKNEYTFTMDEENPYEVKMWVDTGCYVLNAVLSDGDIKKGLPQGKRIMIAGEPSTAKSYLTCFIISKYLNEVENSKAVIFESEGASVVKMLRDVGVPEDRIVIVPTISIEQCRTMMINTLESIIDEKYHYVTSYTEKGEKKRKKLTKEEIKKKIEKDGEYNENYIFVIDSLGMLPTEKEINDVSTGSDKKDMTRAQILKGFGRTISLKLSVAQTPLIIVNHMYGTMDQYNPKEISGGTGPKYMSDITLALFKYKEKENKEQIGVKIKTYVNKSRYMIENKSVDIMLHFKKGLNPWSNIVQLAYDLGVFKKEGFSFILPNGNKAKMKDVAAKPKTYIDDVCFEAIREAIMNNFGFSNKGEIDEEINIEDNEDEIVFEEDEGQPEDSK